MQRRVRITRDRLARHAHNRGRRSIDLQAAATAARTGHAAKRLDADVTKLARRAVNPSPEFSVEDDSAADARAERNHDDALAPATCALPHLADACGVRVILQNGGPLQLAFECCGEAKAVQRGHVRRFGDDALGDAHRAGNDDRDGANLCAPLAAATLTLARGLNDGAHDLARFLSLRRVLLRALVYAPRAVNCGRAQIRPAEVGCDDEFVAVRLIRFFHSHSFRNYHAPLHLELFLCAIARKAWFHAKVQRKTEDAKDLVCNLLSSLFEITRGDDVRSVQVSPLLKIDGQAYE